MANTRDSYITRGFVRRRLEQLADMCRDPAGCDFLERRKKLIESMVTKEARKYLFFETLSIIGGKEKYEELLYRSKL